MPREQPTMEERFLRGGEAVEPTRPRRSLPPKGRFLLAGVGRFVLYAGLAAGAAVGIAVLIGLWRDSDLWRAATVGLYLGGATMISIAVLSSTGGRAYDAGGYEMFELETTAEGRRAWMGQLVVYLVLGSTLIGIGVLLEVAGLPAS